MVLLKPNTWFLEKPQAVLYRILRKLARKLF
jgi:hypothetical protein